jgi:hypothetical protein
VRVEKYLLCHFESNFVLQQIALRFHRVLGNTGVFNTEKIKSIPSTGLLPSPELPGVAYLSYCADRSEPKIGRQDQDPRTQPSLLGFVNFLEPPFDCPRSFLIVQLQNVPSASRPFHVSSPDQLKLQRLHGLEVMFHWDR